VVNRWFSRRAFVLHFLLVTIVPGCLVAGWWQVHRALSGNLLSYFYSIEWPIFAVLGIIAWWQLIHDVPTEAEYANPRRERRSLLHRDDEVPTPSLVWDKALETPELQNYNQYLQALAAGSAGGARKNWANPRGLPLDLLYGEDDGARSDDGHAFGDGQGSFEGTTTDIALSDRSGALGTAAQRPGPHTAGDQRDVSL
jgi:hypothetical protein